MDIVSNLDQYLNLGTLSADSVYGHYVLTQDISEGDDVIYLDNTRSFPNEWGLAKIDDEIVTYTGITTNSLTGVVRGFSGITTYRSPGENDIVFNTTEAAAHTEGTKVENLSTLFLKEFFRKVKFAYTPGLEELEFYRDINVGNVIRMSEHF